MMAWSSLAHSVLMQCLRSSRSVFRLLYTFLAVCPTHCSQLDLNPVETKSILAFRFLLAKTAFFNDVTITSSLRIVMPIVMGLFTIFQSPRMSGWFVPKIVKSCLNLPKLRPKYCRSFFSGHSVYNTIMHYVLKADNVQISLPRLAKNRKLVNEKDEIWKGASKRSVRKSCEGGWTEVKCIDVGVVLKILYGKHWLIVIINFWVQKVKVTRLHAESSRLCIS